MTPTDPGNPLGRPEHPKTFKNLSFGQLWGFRGFWPRAPGQALLALVGPGCSLFFRRCVAAVLKAGTRANMFKARAIEPHS